MQWHFEILLVYIFSSAAPFREKKIYKGRHARKINTIGTFKLLLATDFKVFIVSIKLDYSSCDCPSFTQQNTQFLSMY